MIKLAECTHPNFKKSGKTKAGTQRFKCKDCGKRFIDESTKPLGKMRIDPKQAMMAINMLLEGMSVRATARLTGLDAGTIGDLILTVGEKCEHILRHNIVDVPATDIQIDEIWSFVGMKAKQAKKQEDPSMGDSWTYICIDRNTKLVLAHHVGRRDQIDTERFLAKVRRSIDQGTRVHVSTDGWAAYRYGVPFALGSNIDYGMLIKQYASTQEVTRYSPAQIIRAEKQAVFGRPDFDKICTSHIESFNQTYRQQLKRFSRLTNAHSKSLEHHEAMQAIYMASYNFCRRHSSLDKQTPAMAAGLSFNPLSLLELLTG